MRKITTLTKRNGTFLFTVTTMLLILTSCQKDLKNKQPLPEEKMPLKGNYAEAVANSNYNLEVKLKGQANRSGHIHFRQARDPAKIITLGIKVHHLKPNHHYLLHRAVDTDLDGNCMGIAWMSLGYGLAPHAIHTDIKEMLRMNYGVMYRPYFQV